MRLHLRNNHRCYRPEFGSVSDWLKQTSLTAVTNQKHYSDQGSNTSSLRNFSSRSSQTEGCPMLTANRTIGINGPSVWRMVSVCVYWTCVFGKGFRCEKSSFEFEDVYVMSGLRVSSWQHELQPALDASEVLYRSESKELITIPSRVVNFWNHRRSGSVWVLLFRCTDVS